MAAKTGILLATELPLAEGRCKTPKQPAPFIAFWQDNAWNNPIEIARVSVLFATNST